MDTPVIADFDETDAKTDFVPKYETYTPSLDRQIYAYLLIAMGIFFLYLFSVMPVTSAVPIEAKYFPYIVFTGFLFFDLCLYFGLGLRRIRILVSSWGIQYYSLGTTVRAPWENVVGVANVRMGYETIESLMVNEPAEMGAFTRVSLALAPVPLVLLKISALFTGRWWLLFADMDSRKMERSIPVGYFSKDWRCSAMGSQIKQYVPELREEYGDRVWSSNGTTGVNGANRADSKAGATGGKEIEPPPSSYARSEARKSLITGALVAGLFLAEILVAFVVAPNFIRQ